MTPQRLPAPDHIEPGLMPGGLVFQTWRCRDGEYTFMFEHRLARLDRPEELDYPDDVDLQPGDGVALVVYDGDTGWVSWQLGLGQRMRAAVPGGPNGRESHGQGHQREGP